MKTKKYFLLCSSLLLSFVVIQCRFEKTTDSKESKILFLHHSTGGIIFNGGEATPGKETDLYAWLNNYNRTNGTFYQITEQVFPKSEPYGWKNYPFDYYNIWVKNEGNEAYMEEPTLEMLTPQFDLIIFKHCFPVSNMLEDMEAPDINSDIKTCGNYILQYQALKEKLNSFPNTNFLLWTGAALTRSATTPENAARARAFFEWVKNDWDEAGDNIFIWDFFDLETEGGNYLKPEYAYSETNSHPNAVLSEKVLPLFGNRIADVLENEGKYTNLKGELK